MASTNRWSTLVGLWLLGICVATISGEEWMVTNFDSSYPYGQELLTSAYIEVHTKVPTSISASASVYSEIGTYQSVSCSLSMDSVRGVPLSSGLSTYGVDCRIKAMSDQDSTDCQDTCTLVMQRAPGSLDALLRVDTSHNKSIFGTTFRLSSPQRDKLLDFTGKKRKEKNRKRKYERKKKVRKEQIM